MPAGLHYFTISQLYHFSIAFVACGIRLDTSLWLFLPILLLFNRY
jgi:hypothetical protein